jgi:hypothetical protein
MKPSAPVTRTLFTSGTSVSEFGERAKREENGASTSFGRSLRM